MKSRLVFLSLDSDLVEREMNYLKILFGICIVVMAVVGCTPEPVETRVAVDGVGDEIFAWQLEGEWRLVSAVGWGEFTARRRNASRDVVATGTFNFAGRDLDARIQFMEHSNTIMRWGAVNAIVEYTPDIEADGVFWFDRMLPTGAWTIEDGQLHAESQMGEYDYAITVHENELRLAGAGSISTGNKYDLETFNTSFFFHFEAIDSD